MRDRFILNIVLFASIAALSAVAYWQPEHKEPPVYPRISNMQPETVQHIDLQRRAQQSVSFIRDAQTPGEGPSRSWRLTAPHNRPAKDEKVSALLNILNTRSTAIVAGEELQRFELDEPRVTLRFDQELWSFGASHPLDGRRYVLHNGSVHLVDDRFFHHLIAEPQIYMDVQPDAPQSATDAAADSIPLH